MTDWSNCTKILCIRPDNMGDLLMSGPAIRALKESFSARITVLTSAMAAGIATFMPEIDEIIISALPWVKSDRPANNRAVGNLIASLREKRFDAAVIFTVFSQNPLPSAMLAYQAGIPRVLAYCRENPYGLITNWVPDEEPYTLIRHQVKRDIQLVASVGAKITNERLNLTIPGEAWPTAKAKLEEIGWDSKIPWLVLHPGVSEVKRRYPVERWIATGRKLTEQGYQLVVTGTAGDNPIITEICQGIGPRSFNSAGLLKLDELIGLIKYSQLLLAVNTGPVHIAAAVGTPVVVLYAETNPQHTPWQVLNRVLYFPVPVNLQSKNGVISYLQQTLYKHPASMPGPDAVVEAVENLIRLSVASNQPSL